DETIRQIRSTIFALQAPRTPGRGLRQELLGLVAEASASLGFDPHVRLDGPIDSTVSTEVADQLLATLREALSNVVRHSGATRVDVTAGVQDSELVAKVVDNGVGVGEGERPGGRGLANMEQRAEAIGGTVSVDAGPDGKGTSVTWRVPI